jgi:hypothetical protein
MTLQHRMAFLARSISIVFSTLVFLCFLLLIPLRNAAVAASATHSAERIGSTQAPPVSADSTAFVRIIHASPDIGTGDIFVDGTKLLSSFPFGGVTDYVRVPTGPHKVQVALIGKGPGAAVITQTLTVGPNVPYTVAALGTKTSGFSLQVFTDDNMLAPGKTKVRLYQLSPDAGTLTLAAGGISSINGLSYPQDSDYLTVSPGSYTFNVTTSQGKGNMHISATLKENTITSIFAIGMVNGSPPFQFVTSQVNGMPNWPGTGSDPNLPPAPSLPLTPWVLGILVLVALGASGATYAVASAHQKKPR